MIELYEAGSYLPAVMKKDAARGDYSACGESGQILPYTS
jgi:hypothetical protein